MHFLSTLHPSKTEGKSEADSKEPNFRVLPAGTWPNKRVEPTS